MPGLLIKDVPESLHRRLKARAAQHRRSLHREALILLEEVLAQDAGPPDLAVIDRLRIQGTRPLTTSLVNEALNTGRR